MFLTLKGNKKLTVLSVKNLMRIWRREKDIPRIAVPLMIQGISYINDHIRISLIASQTMPYFGNGEKRQALLLPCPLMPRQFPSRSD